MEYTQNIHIAWMNFIEYMWNTLGYNFPLYPSVFHIIHHEYNIEYTTIYLITNPDILITNPRGTPSPLLGPSTVELSG